MKTSIAKAIRAIETKPDGWLHVEAIQKVGSGVVLSLALRDGKGGQWISGWDVSCIGVREISVSDLDGGGIRLYGSSHPAAKQYATRTAQLRCRPDAKRSAILGALAAAHVATVDDWIPVDRYLPMQAAAKGNVLVRAPDFLVRAYAKALNKLGVVARVSGVARKGHRKPAPRVLHLGNSFVVADRFEATLGAKRLENNQMQRAAPAQAKSRRR
jgi:hypothetical protein